jgi:hypothetical protein
MDINITSTSSIDLSDLIYFLMDQMDESYENVENMLPAVVFEELTLSREYFMHKDNADWGYLVAMEMDIEDIKSLKISQD